jgi:hypothetical protein
MLRDPNNLSSLVLIDFGKATAGNDQLFLRDVREVPVILRYILEPWNGFSSFKMIRRVSIEEVGASCPELLMETIMYALTQETFDPNVYSYMRDKFQLIQ